MPVLPLIVRSFSFLLQGSSPGSWRQTDTDNLTRLENEHWLLNLWFAREGHQQVCRIVVVRGDVLIDDQLVPPSAAAVVLPNGSTFLVCGESLRITRPQKKWLEVDASAGAASTAVGAYVSSPN